MTGAALLSLMLLALPTARAQTSDLVTVYDAAVQHDALLASSRMALEAARERAVISNSGLLPSITNTMSIQRQASESNLAARREFTTRTFSLNLTYPLYRRQNIEAYEQSRLQIALFEAQLEQARQDLMIRVSQAYFDVLSSQDNLTTIRAQKAAISEQLASAKRNFEVGTATVTDQQEAQARFDLNVAQELSAQNDLEIKRAALSLLTGRPVAELNTLGRGIALTPPAPARETEWSGSAREFNLAVMQAQVNAEIARREIDRQRFGHYPTLDVVSSIGRSESATAQFIGVKSNTAGIGLQFSLPIYAGGAIDARVREAIALQSKSATDLEAARRTAEQSARSTFLIVNSGLGQVRALEAAERSSQLALDSNQLGYQVGVRINIDVLNAQQQLFTTRRDLSKARYDVLVNGLKLRQASGTLTEDDLRSVNALLGPPVPDKAEATPAGPRSGSAAPAGSASGSASSSASGPASGSAPAPAGAAASGSAGTGSTRSPTSTGQPVNPALPAAGAAPRGGRVNPLLRPPAASPR